MKCLLCESHKIIRFVDGFGDKRVFCKSCGRSFLENNFIRLSGQRKIPDFNPNLYFRPQISR